MAIRSSNGRSEYNCYDIIINDKTGSFVAHTDLAMGDRVRLIGEGDDAPDHGFVKIIEIEELKVTDKYCKYRYSFERV